MFKAAAAAFLSNRQAIDDLSVEAMCGRYVLVDIRFDHFIHTMKVWVASDDFYDKKWFKDKVDSIRARYDIRPTQEITVLSVDPKTGTLKFPRSSWGVNEEIFDKQTKTMKKINAINARQEKLLSWNVWRSALKHRRCVVPASVFYEWQDRKDSRKRLPWEIRPRGLDTFYFAGLYKVLQDEGTEKEKIEVAILTQPGNDLLRWIHNHGGNQGRQPVFLDDDNMNRWLDPELEDAEEAFACLRQIEDGEWEARALSAIGDDKSHKSAVPRKGASWIRKPDLKYSLLEEAEPDLFGEKRPLPKAKSRSKT